MYCHVPQQRKFASVTAITLHYVDFIIGTCFWFAMAAVYLLWFFMETLCPTCCLSCSLRTSGRPQCVLCSCYPLALDFSAATILLEVLI